MKKDHLKPCPFCGGAASVRKRWGGWVAYCVSNSAGDPNMCAVAPASIPATSKAAALRGWNERKRV